MVAITIDPARMGGVPCVRNLRIPVATVVGSLADGMTETEILGCFCERRRSDSN